MSHNLPLKTLMLSIELIDTALLDKTSAAAQSVPRRRKNYNFHEHEADRCNRLLNAIEPGSYVQPHCHAEPEKAETLVVVRGELGLIVFDQAGNPLSRCRVAPGSSCVGVNIPHGVWHTVLALQTGTVFFESKAGPYCPLAPSEIATWAPAEGTAEASALLDQWRASFT